MDASCLLGHLILYVYVAFELVVSKYLSGVPVNQLDKLAKCTFHYKQAFKPQIGNQYKSLQNQTGLCHSSLIDLNTKETKPSLLSSSTTTALRFRKFRRIQPGAWFHGNSLFATCKLCVSCPPDVGVIGGFSGGCSRVSLVSALNNVSLIPRVFPFSNRLLRSFACEARIWGSCGSYSSADHAVPAVRKIMAENKGRQLTQLEIAVLNQLRLNIFATSHAS